MYQKLLGGQAPPEEAVRACNAPSEPLAGFKKYKAPGNGNGNGLMRRREGRGNTKGDEREEGNGRKGEGGELSPTRNRSLAAPLDAAENRNVSSLDLNVSSESLAVSNCSWQSSRWPKYYNQRSRKLKPL